MPLPALVPLAIKAAPWIAKGIGSLVGANQARQDAKGAAGAANRAADQAQGRYNERAPFRALGQQRLTQPKNYDFSSDFQRPQDAIFDQASGAQSRTLAGLENSPDRMAMVKQALADLDKENAPRLQAGIRGIGQNAARLGRIGSGMVTTSIGDLASDIERDRQTKSNALVRDAVEGDVNDRFRRLSAAGDVAGQRFGFGQADVQNNASRIGAERGARGQDFSEGMALTGLGFDGDPSVTDRWNADRLDKSASDNAGAVGAIAESLGTAFGNRGGAPSIADAGPTTQFRPVRQPIPQVQAGPAPSGLNEIAPWKLRRGTVSSPGPLTTPRG